MKISIVMKWEDERKIGKSNCITDSFNYGIYQRKMQSEGLKEALPRISPKRYSWTHSTQWHKKVIYVQSHLKMLRLQFLSSSSPLLHTERCHSCFTFQQPILKTPSSSNTSVTKYIFTVMIWEALSKSHCQTQTILKTEIDTSQITPLRHIQVSHKTSPAANTSTCRYLQSLGYTQKKKLLTSETCHILPVLKPSKPANSSSSSHQISLLSLVSKLFAKPIHKRIEHKSHSHLYNMALDFTTPTPIYTQIPYNIS